MEIKIRRAVKEDCPRLLELVQELADYEKAPQEVTVTLEHFIESGFGKNPVWWGFIATIHFSETDSPSPLEKKLEGEAVGFALYYIRYSTWKGQAMYLEDILVTNEMRGKGIGKLLFDRLIEEAKEKKLNRIAWQVLDWNEPAINFYKKYNASFDGEWVNCAIYV
ncbi:MAG: GNAT family N-acetyltransferase [Bacteroidetes bacterium]|nr:GNAT family N-acetyltransferase [Bacteroidota bacterium]MBS1632584.1 GNAT family N-acetyltransferase [Bacteroidota bacterium]